MCVCVIRYAVGSEETWNEVMVGESSNKQKVPPAIVSVKRYALLTSSE